MYKTKHKNQEAVGEYFLGVFGPSIWFWSSTTVSLNTNGAWHIYLADGYTYLYSNDDSLNVVCVRP